MKFPQIYLFRRSVFFGSFLSFALLFTSCGGSGLGTGSSKSRKSRDTSLEELIAAYEKDGSRDRGDYVPLSKSRMDHVEYLINKDLIVNGLDENLSNPSDSQNLARKLPPIYFTSGKPWKPETEFSLPVVKNDRVNKWIQVFTGRLRPNFERYIKRMSMYAPVVNEILDKHGVPRDLIYLAMIESGFNMNAYSRAHATGPWQFIRSTGKLYGLNSDSIIDERRDIVKATDAAARHLKDLHERYGDWYLAFAAYNAGPGSVNRAIRKSRSKNYWTITKGRRRYLRSETKNYVPKILAAAIVTKNYRKYGFSSSLFQPPIRFDLVEVPDATDISVIAECSGVNDESIRLLNPDLRIGVTPAGKKYTVKIPPHKAKAFKRKYSKISSQDRVRYAYHRVRKNESLSRIARAYGVSAKELAAVNGLSSSSPISSGAFLRVPGQSRSSLVKFASNAGGATIHRVRSGENLGLIARKYKTSVKSIKRLNKIGKKNIIRVGQKLKVYPGRKYVASNYASSSATSKSSSPSPSSHAKTYEVRSGDNLGKIARKFGVRISQLQAWNGMGKKTRIKKGAILKVSHPGSDSSSLLAKNNSSNTSASQIYTVQRGDNLGKISKKFGVSIKSIQTLNNMGKKTRIKVGQKIRVGEGSEPQLVATKSRPALSQPASHTYKVRSGDTVLGIAKKHGIDVYDFKDWNNIGKKNVIRVGQVVSVTAPIEKTSVPHKSIAEASPQQETYKVKSGDVLGTIAEKHGVRLSTLKAYNRMNNNDIRVGQILKIPPQGSILPKTNRVSQSVVVAKADTSSDTIFHKVKSGETLWDLSRRYGVTVAEIKKWNNLSSSSIRPSQKIKIYALGR